MGTVFGGGVGELDIEKVSEKKKSWQKLDWEIGMKASYHACSEV